MRKIIPFLVVGILVLGGLGAVTRNISAKENISLKSEAIQLSTPIVKENENFATIKLAEATSSLWGSGKPVLPVVTKVYTLPFGTIINNVDVTFSDTIQQKITKPIEPSPEPQMLSTVYKSEQKTTPNYYQFEIYPLDRYYYKAGAGLSGEDHVIYLAVNLLPVQYNPSKNTIYYSTQATIDISYTPPENPVNFPNVYDMLIITAPEFEQALQPLVDYKNQNQIKTIMVTLDDIPSVGIDTQESIKYYIRDAVNNWGITYVILVGAGLKNAEKFPVRYAYIPSGDYENSFPSDLYYADVFDILGGFPDWDFNNNGKYAEFPNDILSMDVMPDVYLGKIPANTSAEVTAFVNKVINYKEHNKMTNKILQVGGDTFPGDDEGVYEGEFANQQVLDVLPRYNSIRLWASSGGDLTKANIVKGFRSNVDFVDFSGHGSWASWATHPPENDGVWLPPKTTISPYSGFLYVDYDLYFAINAKKLPVVFFNACSNNKYTDSDKSLSWKTVNKASGGGIAAFGAAGIGYGTPGSGETSRLMGWMEVNTFEEIYNNKILGQAWGDCVTNYYLNFFFMAEDVDYKTMLEYSMFADPSLAIQNGNNPTSVPVVKPVMPAFLERLLDSFPNLLRLLEQILPNLG